MCVKSFSGMGLFGSIHSERPTTSSLGCFDAAQAAFNFNLTSAILRGLTRADRSGRDVIPYTSLAVQRPSTTRGCAHSFSRKSVPWSCFTLDLNKT